jgi:hypothetical protein
MNLLGGVHLRAIESPGGPPEIGSLTDGETEVNLAAYPSIVRF